MIAVYYNESAGPYTMYVLDVPNDEHHVFLETLEEAGYPFPSAEILFIENERIVSTWYPLKAIRE